MGSTTSACESTATRTCGRTSRLSSTRSLCRRRWKTRSSAPTPASRLHWIPSTTSRPSTASRKFPTRDPCATWSGRTPTNAADGASPPAAPATPSAPTSPNSSSPRTTSNSSSAPTSSSWRATPGPTPTPASPSSPRPTTATAAATWPPSWKLWTPSTPDPNSSCTKPHPNKATKRNSSNACQTTSSRSAMLSLGASVKEEKHGENHGSDLPA
mmetsp:Transcript_32552/g.103797  ORF Transcript_32552/g.103797 Transcript_32552/m.103797 type:complete len:213 (-) Transcript_32552:92-730(-)